MEKKKKILPPTLKQLQIIIVYFPGEKVFKNCKCYPNSGNESFFLEPQDKRTERDIIKQQMELKRTNTGRVMAH